MDKTQLKEEIDKLSDEELVAVDRALSEHRRYAEIEAKRKVPVMSLEDIWESITDGNMNTETLIINKRKLIAVWKNKIDKL